MRSFCAPTRTAQPLATRAVAGRSRRLELSSSPRAAMASRSAGLSVLLAPKANALATATAVEAIDFLLVFPANIKYDILYDITPLIVADQKVLTTLAEAVVLVFLVMLLFLQDITIVRAGYRTGSLLGTSAFFCCSVFPSMLTLFGMVLAIGILVDDAIVVVENVEAHPCSEEGLVAARDATRKAMRQITGAIIGITLVLVSVFVPMAFFPGSVGIIYRQFSASMIAAIGLSSLLALSLTAGLRDNPRPVAAGPSSRGARPVRLVQPPHRGGQRRLCGMGPLVDPACRPPDVDLAAGMLAAVAFAFIRLPGLSCPGRRSGLRHGRRAHAAGGRFPRTSTWSSASRYLTKREGIDTVTFLTGYSTCGQEPEYRAGLHHPEGLVRQRRSGSAGAIVPDINRTFAPLLAQGSPHCSRRRSTTSAIPAASASACRIAASVVMPN